MIIHKTMLDYEAKRGGIMCIRAINQIWEKERLKIENDLKEKLDKEIENLLISSKVEEEKNPQHAYNLLTARTNLLVRKSLLYYETEEILRRRIGFIGSIIAIIISFIAIIISLYTCSTSN